MIDLAVSSVMLSAVVVAALAFAVDTLRHGRRRFDRVEREGRSLLLGRRAMELAYFGIEPLGRLCVRCGVTANAVTAVSLMLGALAGVALALGHFGLAALLSAISASCDALDGMVARLTRTASDAGETFDAAVDRYNEFFFLGGLAFLLRERAELLVLVMAALLGSFMVSYSSAKAEALRVQPPRGTMRRAERATYLTVGAAIVPFSTLLAERTSTGLWIALAPIVVPLALVAIVGNVSAVRRLICIAKLAGQRGAGDVQVTRSIPLTATAGRASARRTG